ncbi:hypothetical protein JNUCC64_21060 [Streptomyces sp. JNUCC 64]
MGAWTRTAAGAVAAIAALSLTACGEGDGDPGGSEKPARSEGRDGGKKEGDGAKGGSPSPEPSVARAERKPLPAAFDNTKGWVLEEPEGAGTFTGDPAIGPDSGLLLAQTNSADGATTRVVAYDGRTGALRWSGKPVARPEPESSAPGYEDVELFVVREGGEEYAVLAVTGSEGGDGVTKEKDVTRVAAYPTSGSTDGGKAVAPVRVTDLPGVAAEEITAARHRGIVLVAADDAKTAANAVTGEVTEYQDEGEEIGAPGSCWKDSFSSCETNSTVVGHTPAGVLVDGAHAFWSGDWYSEDFAPATTVRDDGTNRLEASGTPEGQVLAPWPVKGGDWPDFKGEHEWIWAVHDGRTGKVLASVGCEHPEKPTEMWQSTDGRYVAVDSVVLDLREKRGHCFQETDDRERVTFDFVDGDGTAYGRAGSRYDGTEVSVDLSTGKVSPLPEDTVLPDLISPDLAVVGEEVFPRG